MRVRFIHLKKGQGGYAVRQNEELKFVFHNPNTPEATEDFLSKWIAQICMPQVEKSVREKMDVKDSIGTLEINNVLGILGGEENYEVYKDAIEKRYELEWKEEETISKVYPMSRTKFSYHFI